MTRLRSELQRLYLPPAADDADGAEPEADADADRLIDPAGQVRALVLSLGGPADWAALAAVWRGVQADLGLPAPAIAVAGELGFQLWFSLAQAVPVVQARAFLAWLQARYLGAVGGHRVVAWPRLDASSTPPRAVHARPVPGRLRPGGPWTAFVAPDLAPVFADEPWLDTRPNPDGQADLLSRLDSIPPAAFRQALERLAPAAPPAAEALQPPADTPPPAAPAVPAAPAPVTGPWRDPKAFLLDVMNDDAAPLGLRIEAAKALLAQAGPPQRP